MAQVPHIEAGDTPTDISAGVADGCYVAQVAAGLAEIGDQAVLYATAETAPTDDADYFRAGYGEFFTFTVGDDQPATWVKTSMPGLTVPVALARVS